MKFEIQLAHSVTEIGSDAWDALAANRPFASYQWYRFGEIVLADETPIYIILSHEGKPIARATWWIYRNEVQPIEPGLPRKILDRFIQRWPLMLCQSPLASSSGLVLPENPALRAATFEVIIEHSRQIAKQNQVSFHVFDFLESSQINTQDWPSYLSQVSIPEPETRMKIAWSDYDTYLSHLSRSQRQSLKRSDRNTIKQGVDVDILPQVENVDQVLKLIKAYEKKYSVPTLPRIRRILENIHKVNSGWLAATDSNTRQLVGCGVLLGDRASWNATAMGRDYQYPFVYFGLISTSIKYVIENRGRNFGWVAGYTMIKND